MSLASLCQLACTGERQTTTKGASGGMVKVWNQTLFDGEPCDIQPTSSRDQEFYAKTGIVVNYTFFFTRDVGLRKEDRIRYKGRTFTVHGYQPPHPQRRGWPGKADCEEVVTP